MRRTIRSPTRLVLAGGSRTILYLAKLPGDQHLTGRCSESPLRGAAPPNFIGARNDKDTCPPWPPSGRRMQTSRRPRRSDKPSPDSQPKRAGHRFCSGNKKASAGTSGRRALALVHGRHKAVGIRQLRWKAALSCYNPLQHRPLALKGPGRTENLTRFIVAAYFFQNLTTGVQQHDPTSRKSPFPWRARPTRGRDRPKQRFNR